MERPGQLIPRDLGNALIIARARRLKGMDAAERIARPDKTAGARNAWRRFGRGRHPAALNLGDCFSYALPRDRGAVVLKGEDLGRRTSSPWTIDAQFWNSRGAKSFR